MNDNPSLVANPNRTQIRTEADLRRSTPKPEPEAAPEES